MLLFEDQFISIAYQAEKQLLFASWTPASENLSDEHFKAINKMYIEFVEKYEVKNFLLNTENFLFSITVELQHWVGEHILLNLKEMGLQKVAFIVSKEFIAQLSIELTMQENPNLMSVAYFDNQEEAQKWLSGLIAPHRNLQQF